jgi:hypothetical protein
MEGFLFTCHVQTYTLYVTHPMPHSDLYQKKKEKVAELQKLFGILGFHRPEDLDLQEECSSPWTSKTTVVH